MVEAVFAKAWALHAPLYRPPASAPAHLTAPLINGGCKT